MRFGYISTMLLALCGAAMAQEFRGTITGSITDASSAAVAGATVVVREVNTGTRVQVTSENTGSYTAAFLLPGDYEVTVQMAGFKEFVRKGVHVGAGESIKVDARLEVGDASQSIQVTAEVPLINSENASTGSAITTKDVENVPLNGRSPLLMAQFSIGVMYTPYNSASTVQQPYESANAFSIGGTYSQTSEILIDGAPNTTWDMRSAYMPPHDAVQETRVKAFDTDTAFGRTGGGTINLVVKSGTNELRGSLYEFTQPSNLTANNFFNNQKGLGNPVTHFNQYGMTVGGPVWIPKLIDGRNKLFWLFAWENNINSQPNNNFLSVPTAAQKAGDFSQVLALDGTQLYDPYTGRLSGSTVVRSPYPNNQIPRSQMNPVALKYLQFFPEPNVTSFTGTSRPDGYNNYGNNATSTNDFQNQMGRLDWNMSERSRAAISVRHNVLAATKNNYFQNISTGSITARENWGASLDEVYNLSATSLLNIRLNYTFMNEEITDPSEGVNPVDYGFPTYMASNSPRLNLPYLYFSTSTNVGSLGPNSSSPAKRPSQSLQAFGTYTKIKGNHVFKTGADARQYRLSTMSYGASSGSFNFGNNAWVRSASNASTAVAVGQDIATFLLGLPGQGFYDINTYGSWYSYFAAGFLQDDWRIRRNLTLNLGVRFDYSGPYHEKWARTVNGYDFNSASPIAAAAKANYAKSPNALLPVDKFNPMGGLTFPTGGDTAAYKNTSRLVSPRVGFAWSPDLLGKGTVLRGGVGMFVAPNTISYLSQNGQYSSNPVINQMGFSQQTSMTVTTNNYLSPGAATLSDPFPGGAILRPVGGAQGLSTFLGQNISFLNPEMKNPYSIRWTFGVQRQLSPNTVLEVVYIGNHGVHLPVNLTQLNGVPRQYLSTKPTRDQALITQMTASTANPFAGVLPSSAGSLAGNTISTAQLLSFYPQYPLGYTSGTFTGSGGILEQNLTVGSSYFHSLNVRFEKRLSQGLTVAGNYIYSKLMERTTWLNDTDAQPEKRVSPFDRTHRFVARATYQLPVGRGQALNLRSGWANAIFGGWLMNTVYTRQGGGPLPWMGTSSTTIGDLVYLGGPLRYDPRQTDTVAFNTGAFDTVTANQLNYHIRTYSTTFSSIRGDGIHQVDGSLLKRITIRENMNLQLRFEGFNLANRPAFGFPNVAPTNSGFGWVTSQSNRSRSIQMGARLSF